MFAVRNYAAFGVSNEIMLGIVAGMLVFALVVAVLSILKRCPSCKSYNISHKIHKRFQCNKCGKFF